MRTLIKTFGFVWLSPKVESSNPLDSNLPNKVDSQNLTQILCFFFYSQNLARKSLQTIEGAAVWLWIIFV